MVKFDNRIKVYKGAYLAKVVGELTFARQTERDVTYMARTVQRVHLKLIQHGILSKKVLEEF